VRVVRDFEALYQTEADPWKIGDADWGRYNVYRDLILHHARRRDSLVDIGCGMGAFLARFRDEFARLEGVEVSGNAIARGRERFPFIRFFQGRADRLEDVVDGPYDAIIFSDVVCYLDEGAKHRAMRWIADHLSAGGLAFVAAWCSKPPYLSREQLRAVVAEHLKIEAETFLETEHAAFLGRRRRRLVAVTIDYETWHPIPEGRRIDWQADVLRPTAELLDAGDQEGVQLTFMAEMGEYFWLRENDLEVARSMERQWCDAVRRGHDVQLHLHPNWLPELGAQFDGSRWHWDWSCAKADDYAGDLAARVGTLKSALESLLRPENSDYEVNSFRAGAYQAQPFLRLSAALSANGIFCDSSVYAGGVSAERGYDYSFAFADHQPYFASRYDPQLKAPPAERQLVEIPIFTFRRGERWCLDGEEAAKFADRLLQYLEERERQREGRGEERREQVARLLRSAYGRLGHRRRWANPLLPRRVARMLAPYAPEPEVGHEYFVLIGHTKGGAPPTLVAESLRRLKRRGDVEFVALREMARLAREDLRSDTRSTPAQEAAFQVERESSAVLSDERNEAQARLLQERIPLDRERVLDLGCGAGYWSQRIARLFPWTAVMGLDYGMAFLAKARSAATDAVGFLRGDSQNLPVRDGAFDCIYADNVLEHSFDVDRALAEVFRVLADRGVLVAAIPSDGRNPRMVCDNHIWKTIPSEAWARLQNAGFVNAEIEEIDVRRTLGAAPFPPSDDRVMYVRAWKRPRPASRLERAVEAMDWVYRRLKPERPSEGNDPIEILKGGHAFCWGYAVVLGKLLEREGMRPRWLTMLAENHPQGRGARCIDSHEVVLLDAEPGEVILDPMSNTVIPHPLVEVLREPSLAKEPEVPDERYVAREYRLYSTELWYRRVVRYAIRDDVNRRIWRWRRNRHAAS
jgi:SAM-dependent methyltransferase